MPYGQIILLNGTPRSGKSSIVKAIQDTFDGAWINLGVDTYMRMIPQRYQPGIGLRPGGEGPDLEPLIVTLYEALYASIAAHSRLGIPVVADVGHHDWYSRPLGILPRCARLLDGLPTLFVGVRCPLEAILARRTETGYPAYAPDGSVLPAIQRWQDAVHVHGPYDLEVDTAEHSPEACAAIIREWLSARGPGSALASLAMDDSPPV